MRSSAVLLLLAGSVMASPVPALPHGRIVGGSPADISDFPYQLSLQLRGRHICGASIIAKDWAVTAAHCLVNKTTGPLITFPLDSITLRAGTSTRGSGGSVYKAKRIVVHPSYNTILYFNDIALVQTSTAFKFGPNINKVVLPSPDENFVAGTSAVVSGWGWTREESGASDILLQVAVPVITNAECIKVYGQRRITDNVICAGYPKGGRDACWGDSGGPLVAQGKLIGIVSWGIPCALPSYPGVYTRVTALRSWIQRNAAI